MPAVSSGSRLARWSRPPGLTTNLFSSWLWRLAIRAYHLLLADPFDQHVAQQRTFGREGQTRRAEASRCTLIVRAEIGGSQRVDAAGIDLAPLGDHGRQLTASHLGDHDDVIEGHDV